MDVSLSDSLLKLAMLDYIFNDDNWILYFLCITWQSHESAWDDGDRIACFEKCCKENWYKPYRTITEPQLQFLQFTNFESIVNYTPGLALQHFQTPDGDCCSNLSPSPTSEQFLHGTAVILALPPFSVVMQCILPNVSVFSLVTRTET